MILAMPLKGQGWLVPQEGEESTDNQTELAKLVRAITGDVPRMTAAIRSGVSHDTIARLWRGERVSEATLLRFALGYHTDPNPLLVAAGYSPIKLPKGETKEEGSDRSVQLSTGDWITLAPHDDQPELTAQLVEAYIMGLREKPRLRRKQEV